MSYITTAFIKQSLAYNTNNADYLTQSSSSPGASVEPKTATLNPGDSQYTRHSVARDTGGRGLYINSSPQSLAVISTGSGIYMTGNVAGQKSGSKRGGEGIYMTGSHGSGKKGDLVLCPKDCIPISEGKNPIKTWRAMHELSQKLSKKKKEKYKAMAKAKYKTHRQRNMAKFLKHAIRQPKTVQEKIAESVSSISKGQNVVPGFVTGDLPSPISVQEDTTASSSSPSNMANALRSRADKGKKPKTVAQVAKENTKLTVLDSESRLANLMNDNKKAMLKDLINNGARESLRNYKQLLKPLEAKEDAGLLSAEEVHQLDKAKDTVKEMSKRQKEAETDAMIVNGSGIATSVLKPLLDSVIQTAGPEIVKGISSAIGWLGKKITGHGISKAKSRRNKNKYSYMMAKGEGLRFKKIFSGIKKLAKKGVPIIAKLGKSLAKNEDLIGKVVKNKDHRKIVMSLMDKASDIIDKASSNNPDSRRQVEDKDVARRATEGEQVPEEAPQKGTEGIAKQEGKDLAKVAVQKTEGGMQSTAVGGGRRVISVKKKRSPTRRVSLKKD